MKFVEILFVIFCIVNMAMAGVEEEDYKRENSCQVADRPANGDLRILRKTQGGTGSILLPGDKMVFSCQKGYMLLGSKVRRCEKFGFLSGYITSCIKVVCYIDKLPKHTQITNGMVIDMNDYARFQCDPGYTMTGRRLLRCTNQGVFKGEIPKCTKAESLHHKVEADIRQ